MNECMNMLQFQGVLRFHVLSWARKGFESDRHKVLIIADVAVLHKQSFLVFLWGFLIHISNIMLLCQKQ